MSLVFSNKNLYPAFFLLLVVTILFLPAFLGWQGIFHDDQLEWFPRHYFVAKNLQQGIIPLWDPQNWCGAIPFYARYFADTYYLPLWPFFFLANLSSLKNCYWMFVLLPLYLQYIIAAVGMYYFVKKVLRCNAAASCFGALAFIFSPIFSYAYSWQQAVGIQTWMPWLFVSYIATVRKYCLWKMLLAGGVFALMITSAAPNYIIFVAVIWFFLILVTIFLSSGDNIIVKIFKPLIIAGGIAIVGILLSSIYLFPIIEGNLYTERHIDLNLDYALEEEVGSLPVPWLATLIIPNIFGNITGINMAALNPSHRVLYWEANMSSGIAVTLLVILGFLILFSKSVTRIPNTREKKFFVSVFLMLYFLAVFLVLGRHTPVYRHLIGNIPIFDVMIRPIRYRYLQCFAAAALGALSVDFICNISKPYLKRIVWGYAFFCFALVSFVIFYPFKRETVSFWETRPPATVRMMLPAGSSGGNFAPDYKIEKVKVFFSGFSEGEIRYADNEKENDSRGGILAKEYRVLDKGFHDFEVQIPAGKFVWIYQKKGSAEIGSVRWHHDGRIYDSINSKWKLLQNSKAIFFYVNAQKAARESFFDRIINSKRGYVSNLIIPVTYLLFALAVIVAFIYFVPVKKWLYLLAIIASLEYAVTALAAFYRSNYSWVEISEMPEQNQRAVGPNHIFLSRMGEASHLIPKETNLRIATSNPYHDNFARIFDNSALMGYEMHPLEARFKKAIELACGQYIDYKIYHPHTVTIVKDSYFLDNFSVGYFLDKGKDLEVFKKRDIPKAIDPETFLHINKNPLPRVYTLDKVIIAQDEEQLNNLVKSDLRRAVYTDFNPNIKYDNKIEDDYLGHFANLQRLNVIREVDFSNPNRVTLKADITIPSMMVFTEVWYPGWKARVDGRPQEIYRVNYCQRGIWLDEGQHEVEIFFLPSIWKKGKAVSVASLVLAVLLFTANLLYCKKSQTAGR